MATKVILKWNSAALVNQTRASMIAGLEQIARDTKSEWQRILSRPYPPAAKRGQAPAMRSGQLARDITSSVTASGDKVTMKVTAGAKTRRGLPLSGILEREGYASVKRAGDFALDRAVRLWGLSKGR
jgi:hypothetical protein